MSISLKQLLYEGVNYTMPWIDVAKATRGGGNPATKEAARRLFYDFYAMSNMHYQFGRPNLSTAAKVKASMNMPDFGAGFSAGVNWPEVEFPTTGVILPHKTVKNIEKVYEQVTHAIASKLIEYLKMATLQELRHIITQSNGWKAFRQDLVSILNNKGTISNNDFKKAVKTHIPDMSNDLPSVMRLLKFSKYYSKMKGSSGEDAFDSARKNVPIPGKPLYKSANEPEVAPEPEPSEVPEPTSPESGFPDDTDFLQEPIDDPFADEPTGSSLSSKDPSYSDDDYYWDPELKQQLKAKGHNAPPDKKKLEEDYASGKISLSTITKIRDAAEKAGLTLQDIDNAYNKVPWGGGYGGPKWGTGTQALIKLENDKYKTMSVETLTQHVDHIFDLVHNGGPILNKGGFYMDEVDLDRRAKTTDIARFLPHVSPLIQRLITMVLRYLYKNPEEQKNIDSLLNSSIKSFTPEEDKAISDITDAKVYPLGDARRANIRFFSKKKDDYGDPIEVQGRYYEIKVHTNGKYTIADDLRADIQVFDKFEDVIKYISTFKNDIKGGGSSGYTAPAPAAPWALQMYITSHERIKLPVDKEQLLYEIKMGWRTKSKYYKAYYPGDKRFLLYAFGDGTFLAHYTNNAPAYKTFNDWATMFDYCKEQTATADDTHQAEALANIGGTFSGKTVAPASTPSVAPPAPPKPTTPFSLSPVEQQALAQFISNTYPASSSEKYNVGPLNNGMVVVQKVKNNNPVDCFRVGMKVGMAYGKKYTLEHHLGGGSPAEKWGFNDWTGVFTFIKAHIEQLTVGAPLANQATTPGTTSTPGFYTPKILPAHSTSKASYTVHSGITSPPKSTIRLTQEDEAIVQAAGFEPKMMGQDIWYVHKTNGDSVKFFPNDTAKLIFTNKSTFSGAPILKFTIDKMLKWLPMNYNASTTASPIQTGAAPMPTNPSVAASTPVATPSSIGAPKPTGKGIQLGSIYEKQFNLAGFQWDSATDRYVDGDNSLVINKDRSSILTIGQDAPQHFKNLPDLVNHLIDEYLVQKKSKPIKNLSTEQLKQHLAKGGFKKVGVPPVSSGKGIKYANDKKDVIVVYANKSSNTYDATYHLWKHFDTIEGLNDYLENELLATSSDLGGLETEPPTVEHKNGITPEEKTQIATVVNNAGEQYWTQYVTAAPDQTAHVEIFKKNSSQEPATIVFSVGALGNYYQINDANNKPVKSYPALELLLPDLKYLLEHGDNGGLMVMPSSIPPSNSPIVTKEETKGIQDIASKYGYITSWNSGQGRIKDFVAIFKKPKDETVPAKYPLAHSVTKNGLNHYVISDHTGKKLKSYTGYDGMLSGLDITLSGAEDSTFESLLTDEQVKFVGDVVESYPGWSIYSNNIYIAIVSPKKGTLYSIDKHAGQYRLILNISKLILLSFPYFEGIITGLKTRLSEETGGQGGQSDPTYYGPTPTPSSDPDSISSEEYDAIKAAGLNENVEVVHYSNGVKSGGFLYVHVGEKPYYIIRKKAGEYEMLYSVEKGSALSEPPYGEPYLTHMWTKLLPEYSLIKNPNVTDFNEFMGYIKEIFHNIADNNKVLGEPEAIPAADPNKFSADEVEKLDDLVSEPLGWWYGKFQEGEGLFSGKSYIALVQLDNKKKKYLYLFKIDGKYEAFKLNDNTMDKLISTENFPTLYTVVGGFMDTTFGQAPKKSQVSTTREKLFDRILRKAKQLNGVFMGAAKFGKMLENNEFSWNKFDKCYMNEELKQIVVVTPEFGKNKFHLFWITSEGTEGHSNPNQTELFPLIGPNGNLNIDKEGYEKSKLTPSGETYATHANEPNTHLIKLNAHDEALLAKCGFGWTPTQNYYYTNTNGDILKFCDTGKAQYYDVKDEDVTNFKDIPHALNFIVVKYLDPSKGLNSIPPPAPDVIKISPFSDENYKTNLADGILAKINLNAHDASLLNQIGYEWKEGKEAYVKLVKPNETPTLEEARKKRKKRKLKNIYDDPPKPEPDLTLKSDDDEPDVPDNSEDEMPPDYDLLADADIYEVIYVYNNGQASWTETHEPYEMDGDTIKVKDGTIKEILDFVWNRWSNIAAGLEAVQTLKGGSGSVSHLDSIAKGHPFPNHADFGKVIDAGFKWDEDTGTYTRGYEKIAVYSHCLQYWANFKDDPGYFYTGKNLDNLVSIVNHHTEANILTGVSPTSKPKKITPPDNPEAKRIKALEPTNGMLKALGFEWISGLNLYNKGGNHVIFIDDGKIYYNIGASTEEFDSDEELLAKLKKTNTPNLKISTSNFDYAQWAKNTGEKKGNITISLVPEDSAIMKMMGFELKYTGANKEPKYSYIYTDKTGNMVIFKINGIAEYSDNGSNVTKFNTPKFMIEWMWNNYATLISKKDNGVVVPASANAAKGNPVDLLAVMGKSTYGKKMVEEIKKLGFKPLNQQDHYYTKYDNKWIHSVELDGGKGTLEYVKSTNDVTHSKIEEQWKMPFKEGMERLREKFGVPTKPVSTGTMPFSDVPYHDLWKTQNINQNTSVQLTQEDDQTMNSMGFELMHTGIGGYFYQKGIEVVSFYADGTAKFWPNNSLAKTEKFPSVKSMMEFLWKKYAPFIEEKLNEKLDYKSMMSLTFE